VEARSELAPVLTGNRELLYLDLALEDQVGACGLLGVYPAGSSLMDGGPAGPLLAWPLMEAVQGRLVTCGQSHLS
jgi:hypothetical protein